MHARDVMTGSLISCSPQISAAEAARLMRDRNTGDVLVTDDGKLVGIVTDRDIAVRVAAKRLNPTEVPVHQIATKHVVTGQPHWDLDKLATTMGKHQIRRLPIVDRGMLVGMVSLGDIALRHNHSAHVAKSLKQISEPRPVHRLRNGGRGRLVGTLGMALLAGAAVALTLSPKQLSGVWGQIRSRRLGDKVMDSVSQVRDRLSKLTG
jgi:CBS domain-containing protein